MSFDISVAADRSQHFCVRLTGPENIVMDAVKAGGTQSFQATWRDPAESRFPIFIPSRGRAKEGLLNLETDSALGGPKHRPSYVVIVVVRHEEEAEYRFYWPQALFLVLPPAKTRSGAGLARYTILATCTYGYIKLMDGRVESFQFPFVYILDDCISEIFPLHPLSAAEIESINAHNKGTCLVRLRRERVLASFCVAFTAVQAQRNLKQVSVVGFLRDDGLCCTKKEPWTSGKATVYKVVLLNTVALKRAEVMHLFNRRTLNSTKYPQY